MILDAEITPVGFIEHYISDGVYCKVLHIRAGDIAIGYKHKTTHLSILLKGECLICIDGEVRHVKAPYFFEALEGSRKAAYAVTDVQIMNIIPTDLKDIEAIEDYAVDKTVPKDLSLWIQPLKQLTMKEGV